MTYEQGVQDGLRLGIDAAAREAAMLLLGDGPKDYDEGPGYERAIDDLRLRLKALREETGEQHRRV